MARRSTLALPALVSALVLTACGGTEDVADDEQTRTAGPTSQASTSVPEQTASPSPPGRPTASATATPSPSRSGSPGESTPGSAAWSTSPTSGEAASEADRPYVLEAVRAGRHETFHRVVFEFSGGTPEFYAEYTDSLRQGGSGRKVAVDGEHVLLLVFHGMSRESHFDSAPSTSVVREVVSASVFEGDMRIGIGLDDAGAGRPGFRVSTFGDRVVVDFAHTG